MVKTSNHRELGKLVREKSALELFRSYCVYLCVRTRRAHLVLYRTCSIDENIDFIPDDDDQF